MFPLLELCAGACLSRLLGVVCVKPLAAVFG